MSRPRRPYGPKPPGRLAGTMIKVLAAELSDAGRLTRGKRYWADDAVIDIVVGHGVVTAEVQGARPQPYVVTLEAERGSGVPARSDLWVACTCPDDPGTGTNACKHIVAALFALSDEVAIEPELVDRWRRNGRQPQIDRAPGRGQRLAERPSSHEPSGTDDERDNVIELRPRVHPELEQIGTLLQAPTGGGQPQLPEPQPLDQGAMPNRLIGDVLDDALDHLAISWE